MINLESCMTWLWEMAMFGIHLEFEWTFGTYWYVVYAYAIYEYLWAIHKILT